MGMFKKTTDKGAEILQNHRLNLEDVCLIFSSSRIRSSEFLFNLYFLPSTSPLFRLLLVNDAQKVRAKKTLDDVLNGLRDQHAFFDLDQTDSQQTLPVNTQLVAIESTRPSSNLIVNEQQRRVSQHSNRRSVSFADQVNVMNDDDEQFLPPQSQSPDQEHFDSSSLLINSSTEYSTHPEQFQQRTIENDFYNYSTPIVSTPPTIQQQQQQHRSTLPSKYRLPFAKDVLVNKMDSNLRMLIIKELSKNGYTEQPLSRMSEFSKIFFCFSKRSKHSFRFGVWWKSTQW